MMSLSSPPPRNKQGTRAPAAAAQLVSCFEQLSAEIEGAVEDWVAEMNQVTLSRISTKLDGAALDQARQRGRTLALDEAVALALEALGGASEPA